MTSFSVKALDEFKIQRGTFYIAVWGCQMNVYDTGRIRDLLSSKGYAEVSAPNEAEVVVLVTCAVRAKAENKVFNQIDAWRHQGAVGNSTVVALGGCVGTELGQKILDEDRGVSIVFSPKTIHRLPDLIELYKATGRPVCDVDADSMEKFDSLPMQGRREASAFVTIMEGCSNKCTYCIVPYTRGEEKSRPVSEILSECRAHLASGAREIHLLGQNVNSFCGLNDDGSECSFAELLYEIAALKGLERLRFTTSNRLFAGYSRCRAHSGTKRIRSYFGAYAPSLHGGLLSGACKQNTSRKTHGPHILGLHRGLPRRKRRAI